MSVPAIKTLMQNLNYNFKDESLLIKALSHRSMGENNNERLEFLGDAIINFIIAEKLFQQFSDATEGQMSRLRAVLVKRDALALIARQLRLGDYLLLGPGELKTGGSHRDSILSDAMEAIIGAVYLDGGLDLCTQRILAWYQPHLFDLSLEQNYKDPKTELQEILQAKRQPLPHYELATIEGEEHSQEFIVQCSCTLTSVSVTGQGSSRRRAEQDAAAKMIGVLDSGK